MTGIHHIREELGVSQQDMADYLGLTRQHLSMAELGNRSLPTAALLKLVVFEKNMPTGTSAVPADVQAWLQHHAKHCLSQAGTLEKRLEIEIKGFHTAQKCLQTMQALVPLALTEKERLWLEVQAATAQKKCGIKTWQRLLRLQGAVENWRNTAARALAAAEGNVPDRWGSFEKK